VRSSERLSSPAGDPNFSTSDDLKRHPKFKAAVDVLIDGMADLYGDDVRLVRNLFEYDRAILFMMAVGIDALNNGDPSSPPMSVATLAEAGAQMGIGPLRRIRRLVDEMRKDGMLITETLSADRRRHRLRSTERMLEIDREWLAAFHAPLLEMIPDEPRYQAAMARDPVYHQAYRFLSQDNLGMANRVMTENPPVDFFLRHVSGARLLAVLLQAARNDPDGWTAAGFYSAAAKRTSTSRVQVRAVLHLARDAGLVELSDEGDGRVRVTPELRDGFAKWAADALLAVDLVSAFGVESARRRRALEKVGI